MVHNSIFKTISILYTLFILSSCANLANKSTKTILEKKSIFTTSEAVKNLENSKASIKSNIPDFNLEKLFPRKRDKWESPEDYLKRKQSFDESKIYYFDKEIDGISYNFNSNLVIVTIPGFSLLSKYDHSGVSFFKSNLMGIKSMGYRFKFQIAEKNMKHSSYIGSNAYGAKKEIYKITGDKYYLIVINPVHFRNLISEQGLATLTSTPRKLISFGTNVMQKGGFNAPGLEIEMSPEEAKRIDEQDTLIVRLGFQICSTSETCSSYDSQFNEPTITSPVDKNVTEWGRRAEISTITIFTKKDKKHIASIYVK